MDRKKATAIVFLIAAVWILINPAIASAHWVKSEYDVQYSMIASGFNPNSIEAYEGAIVIFKNDDTKPHWPELTMLFHDVKADGPIPSGAEWRVQPMVQGTWHLHDKLNTKTTGSLTIKNNPYSFYFISNAGAKIPTGRTELDAIEFNVATFFKTIAERLRSI